MRTKGGPACGAPSQVNSSPPRSHLPAGALVNGPVFQPGPFRGVRAPGIPVRGSGCACVHVDPEHVHQRPAVPRTPRAGSMRADPNQGPALAPAQLQGGLVIMTRIETGTRARIPTQTPLPLPHPKGLLRIYFPACSQARCRRWSCYVGLRIMSCCVSGNVDPDPMTQFISTSLP